MTDHRQPLSEEEFCARLAHMLTGDDAWTKASAPGDAELRSLHVALRGYRGETLQWAQRRSAGQPSLASLAQKQERWATLPRWSLALVALVTIAGGVAHLASSRAAIEQSTTASDTSLPPIGYPSTPADIAADNKLLSSIDQALSYHAASPVDSLNLQNKRSGTVDRTMPGVSD